MIMNDETYEALKEVVKALKYSNKTNDFSTFILNPNNYRSYLVILQNWIDEYNKKVKKEGGL